MCDSELLPWDSYVPPLYRRARAEAARRRKEEQERRRRREENEAAREAAEAEAARKRKVTEEKEIQGKKPREALETVLGDDPMGLNDAMYLNATSQGDYESITTDVLTNPAHEEFGADGVIHDPMAALFTGSADEINPKDDLKCQVCAPQTAGPLWDPSAGTTHVSTSEDAEEANSNPVRTPEEEEAKLLRQQRREAHWRGMFNVRVREGGRERKHEFEVLHEAAEVIAETCLRDHVTLPPDPDDPSRPFMDIHEGGRIPVVTCAVKNCTWHTGDVPATAEELRQSHEHPWDAALREHVSDALNGS